MQYKATDIPLKEISNLLHSSSPGDEEGDEGDAPKLDKGKKKQDVIQPASQDSDGAAPRGKAKFDPNNLKDEEGTPVLIATTSSGRRSRDVWSAEPAFVQAGKRKANQLELDEEEDGEWVNHEERSKRPRQDDYYPYLDVPSISWEGNLERNVIDGRDGSHAAPTEVLTGSGSGGVSLEASPFWEISEEDTLFNILAFSLFDETSLISEYENGDGQTQFLGSQFETTDCIHESAVTAVDPQDLEQPLLPRLHKEKTQPSGHKTHRRVTVVTWDDVYQPTFTLPATAVLGVEPVNAGVNDQDVHSSDHHPPLCHAANRTTESSSTASPVTVPVTPPLAPPTVVGDGSSETSGDETSGDETDMSPSEVRFPYTSKVGERIKRLVAAKNATAARGYIPSDQDIAAAEGADITRLGLRNPWAKKKLFYCRFKARLIDGTWDYSDLPCHEEEGQNIGYSTRDDLVRHLREHHYEMVRPPEKKKGKGKMEESKSSGAAKTGTVEPNGDNQTNENDEDTEKNHEDEEDDEYVP